MDSFLRFPVLLLRIPYRFTYKNRAHIILYKKSRSHPRRNGMRFLKHPHDSDRVLCVVPVQRSISERSVSYPK